MKALLSLALAVALLVVLVSCVPVQAPAAPVTSTSAPVATTVMMTGTAPITATITAPITGTVAPTMTATVTPTAVITATAAPTETLTPAPTPILTATLTPTVPVETPTAAPPPTATPVPPPPTATTAPTPTPGPPPTATPLPSAVFVRNDRSFREGSSLVVVGEVVNGSPGAVYNVKVIATFFDAASKLVGAQEAVAYLPQTVPTQANPFRVELPNAPGTVAGYELALTWDDLTIATYDRVTITREEVRQENGLTLVGDLRNDHRSDIRNIVVVATFYDAQGLVLTAIPGSVGASVLAPGATTTFTINSPQPLQYSSYLIQTEGLLLP